MKPDATVDARGTLCPEPVLRARFALARMDPGGVLALMADDPMAELDLKVYCDRAGHEWVAVGEGGQRFLIRKRKD